MSMRACDLLHGEFSQSAFGDNTAVCTVPLIFPLPLAESVKTGLASCLNGNTYRPHGQHVNVSVCLSNALWEDRDIWFNFFISLHTGHYKFTVFKLSTSLINCTDKYICFNPQYSWWWYIWNCYSEVLCFFPSTLLLCDPDWTYDWWKIKRTVTN